MNRSEFLFWVVDVLFHIPQNYVRVKGISCVKDIVYDDKYPDDCTMDIYFKENAPKPMPVIVNIHGGGFVKGDKKHRISIAHMYAARGWFVVNINYRLSPAYPFPASTDDTLRAINYLKTLREKYDINLDKVVLTGDSAGAFLAASAESVITNPDLRERLGVTECDIKPAGLALFCGPYDLVAAMKTKLPFGILKSIAESFTGMKLDKTLSNISEYKYLNDISPISYVNSEWPPTVLSMSKKDFFCKGHGELMYDKLKAAGVKVEEHHSVKGFDNHCYHFNYWRKASKEALSMVFGFLDGLYALEPETALGTDAAAADGSVSAEEESAE